MDKKSKNTDSGIRVVALNDTDIRVTKRINGKIEKILDVKPGATIETVYQK